MSLNSALDTILSAKSFEVSKPALFVCNVSISDFASVKLFKIAVKLSLNPCELLSCPAVGNNQSTLPCTILLAIY